MRTAFIETLCQLAAEDPRIWLLTGDLGYSVLEVFARQYPQRYVNVGVAEQNMTGVAAGLAMSGKIVFTYSIANFPTLRCLEQIRNDVCYHNVNVKVIAVGGGLSYASLGYTHHGVEDMAILRVLPNMTVVAPGDPVEARLATAAIARHSGPCYLRLGKAGEPVVHQQNPDFTLGKVIPVRDGSDITMLSTGAMLQAVVMAADMLAREGISPQVISVPTVQPLDEPALVAAAHRTGRVITIEEHGPGGLGDAVAEVLLRHEVQTRFKPLRLSREPLTSAGSQASMRARNNLSPEAIARVAGQWIGISSR